MNSPLQFSFTVSLSSLWHPLPFTTRFHLLKYNSTQVFQIHKVWIESPQILQSLLEILTSPTAITLLGFEIL
jgi:hypothetical protein